VLSYSRVPFAAAASGHFFRGLARTHPRGDFPHRSLLLIGVLSALACLVDLPKVIAALLVSRILIQFVGQIATVIYLRSRPDLLAKMRFRMPFYPLPALISLAGWLWVFGTSELDILAFGMGSIVLGAVVYRFWDRGARGDEPLADSAHPKEEPLSEL
jgi:amino acid transporter